jgi:hypothetical protein
MPEFNLPLLTIDALKALVTERGYQVEPAHMEVDGGSGMYGAHLRGPRGNKHFLACDREGRFSRSEAVLWCDGVDYSTGKMLAKQGERRRKALKGNRAVSVNVSKEPGI